jgi:hypothetical protein
MPALTFGCGLILFFSVYLSKKKVNIAFTIVFIELLSFIYLARRSIVFSILGFIIFAYLLNIRNKYRPLIFRTIPLLVCFGFFFILRFPNAYTTITLKMTERFSEDTRSSVFEMFFYDIQDHMVFGKGMNATYFCPLGGEISEEDIVSEEIYYRDVVENGYLQLLLSGGIVHIFLFFLLLFPAAINGIFRSSNQFTRACGIIIFLWLVDMIPYGLPSLSLHYIFVWICVGLCYKPSIRAKTDDEIRNEFQNIDLV